MADTLDRATIERPMRAGRRSTIWCSARCSSAGAAPRSRRPSASAGASWRSASAPASRCPTMRAQQHRRHRHLGADAAQGAGARRRARLSNVEALAVMDAKHLAFPDDAFDVIVAQYVITAVPDPEATLDEFARVLKPGGEIVLVNHIGAESGLRKLRATASRRSRAGSAGGPNFPGSGSPPGRRARPASISSSAGRCRRSGIFR